ncbi:MAG: TRAP transporter substrate-binding protein DctP [Thermodesulfobacteriota bacterium]|nr:TRAP transporter substrate-binding protein DctP [Thermodesulfobacteriota bacterium]
MFTKHLLTTQTGRNLIFSCIALVLTVMQPVISAAMTPQESRSVIKQTIASLWTETRSPTPPALKKQQDALKNMLAAGSLSKSDLKLMVGDEIMAIMNQQEANRYVFNTIDKPFDSIFAPYITWETVKEIMWGRASAPAKEQVVITIGTLAPNGTPYLSVPRTTINPRINKLTKGKIKIKIYGGGVMGEDTDILRKMDIGQLTGCGCTSLGVLKAAPDMSVFTLPGLFKSYEEVDYVFKKYRKRIDQAFEERDYFLAALIDTGFFRIYSKKKIASIEDVRKNKMLTWTGQIETTLYDKLGINPTPVAVPEVISALSTGLADTNLAPAVWMLGMQGYQYANYYLDPPIMYSPAAIIVSANIKGKIQKEIGVSDMFAQNFKEFFLSEYNFMEPLWRAKIREYDSKAMDAFQKKCGIKAMPYSDEDWEMIKKASVAVREELADKAYPRELMEGVLATLEEYRQNNQ